MRNIADLILTVQDETGLCVRMDLNLVTFDTHDRWYARITESDETLLDRNGEHLLCASGVTPEEALAALDKLCA